MTLTKMLHTIQILQSYVESDVEGKKKFFFSLKSIGKGVKNNIYHTILFYNKNNRYIYLKYFYVIRQV